MPLLLHYRGSAVHSISLVSAFRVMVFAFALLNSK
uniref:Uncharacterized protein n=1 Tax=Anguilla anguilla TaxID=7936 RepID=A0A0E9QW39_ANGAN